MNEAWVVVAESSQARFFTANTPIAPLSEVKALKHPESRAKNHELASDGAGLSFQSAGYGRHTTDQHTEPKHHEMQVFAREVVNVLEHARNEHKFRRLVVVAPPAFLGEMRRNFSNALHKLVIHEVHKNVVHQEPKEIRSHLPEKLWLPG